MFTEFLDMSSGGGQKLPHGRIVIEAPEAEAISVFFSRFGRNPNRVTCTCCGPDFSISEVDEVVPDGYFDRKGLLVISADEIAPGERNVAVPEEGFVWK